MLLELRRSGGFTGSTKRWRVDTGNDAAWQQLVDTAGLRYRGAFLRVLRVLLIWPGIGATHHDSVFDIWVDGRRATFRGVDVTGGLSDLVDRIIADGEEMDSRATPPSG
jgi:hypothetical protein